MTVAPVEFDVFSRTCPSRQALERVTGRWGSLVLVALTDDTVRFNELRRRVDGVSQKILAQTLLGLERDGLVRRDQLVGFPLRVEYSLTSSGHDITARLAALIAQLEGSMDAVLAAQARFDERGKDSAVGTAPSGA